MLGAIIGDIAGSRHEFAGTKSKDFELFTDKCRPTDDTYMTIAVARAIMATVKSPAEIDGADREYLRFLSENTVRFMRKAGRKHPEAGYGERFSRWLADSRPKPYNSLGNGAAMRVSPVGFAARTKRGVSELCAAVTGVTHNHPEGLLGAESVAMCIFMARGGSGKDEIREYVNRCCYPLDFSIDGIRDEYEFDVTCRGSVPQAIECFLESDSFEDAVRTAVSLGGDADTQAAIAGAIAEAYYGIPDELAREVLGFLGEDELRAVIEWRRFIASTDSGAVAVSRGQAAVCSDVPEGEKTVYVSVSFDGSDKTLYYICGLSHISPGDEVLCPFGAENTERAGIVCSVGRFARGSEPYPPEKTKSVIARLSDLTAFDI